MTFVIVHYMLRLEIKIRKTENISIYRNHPDFHELPLFSYNLSWKERKDIKTDYCFEIFGYGTINNSFYYASNYCLDEISDDLLTLINIAWDEVIKNNMSYLSFFYDT